MAANPAGALASGAGTGARGAGGVGGAGGAGDTGGTGGTGAGAGPNTLGDVRATITTTGMTNTQRNGMSNAHDLIDLEDLEYIQPQDVENIVKVYNDTVRAAVNKVGFVPTLAK